MPRIVFCLFALWCALVAPVARAGNVGIEIDLEDDALTIEFSEPMRVLDNVELRDLVTSIPARRFICVWEDDVELNCKIEGDPLPPATPVTLQLADGLQTAAGRPLPRRTLKTETPRPTLRASINGWEGARPRIVIESERALALDAVASVLRLRSNGREWSNLSLLALPIEGQDWLKSRFALALPGDIDAGAEVELRIVPGLRTTEGPLTGKDNARLLRFIDREPFQLRMVSCAGPSRQVQRTVRNGLLNTFCVPGEPVWLTLSSPLDAAGRTALAAMLPKALTIEDSNDTPWWPGARGNDTPQRRPGAGIQLRFDTPLANETFDLGATVRDDQGRALSPVRLRIATSEARPQLQASAHALLLGDPTRDPIRSVNAEPVELQVAALAGGFATGTVNAPDSRGRATGVNAEASARALAAGGWAQWRHGSGTMHVAAPQFELGAYATRRELVAWATEWRGATAIADAEIELLLLIDGGPPTRIAAGRSDRDGLLRLRLPDDVRLPAQKRGVPPPQWLLRAQAGARRAVLPLQATQGYGLNLGAHRIDARLWGVADRPLYRAGDTVRYSLWQRARSEGRLLRMPETAPVELSLYFSDEDKTLRTWTATPDDMGRLVGEERLPQHLVDGNYCVRAKEALQDNSGACFFVGTYRSQDLWAEAKAEDRLLRDGDTFVADISAGYYSGGGAAEVALGRVTTMLTGLPLSSAYPAYADYAFVDVNRGVGREGVSLQGESRDWGKLDRDGRKRIELPLAFKFDGDDTEADLPAFGRLQLTAEVMLEAREGTMSNAAQARYARYARYVGLRIAPRWFDATTPLRLDGVVIDADGRAQAGAAIEVVVEYLPGFGFGGDHDKDAKREAIARCALVAGTATTCDFPRKRSGRYLLTARSGNAAPVEIERYVWAGGSGDATAQRLAIEIVEAPATPDAPARLLLKSPYARAQALIVIESEGALLDSRVIAIDGGAHELLLPLHADGRSQVRVHALVRERADAGIDANGLRLPAKRDATSITVEVPRRDRAPQMVLTLDKERTAPAQVLRIRLHNGGSTPRTATLAVLDDAVRALGAQWWADFDPQGERWLGMRADEWSNRPFLAGFRDWNTTPWQRRLPWRGARQPAEDAAQPDVADAAAALPEEPPPVIFDEPSPVDAPAAASAPAATAALARANGEARASTVVNEAPQVDAYSSSDDGLDRIEVTGSRISRVDVFKAGEGPSPILTIDRAQIEAEGLKSAGDVLHGSDDASLREGPGRLDAPPPGRDRNAQRTADAKALFGARVRRDFADAALWQPDIRLAPGETRTIEFTVPDNLTRWRAVAWSSDADDGFEMTEATFEVGLPLEVRLQTPVRVYPGDRADLVANIRQNGDRAVDVDATLQIDALAVDATRTLALAPRGQATLPLRIAPVDADLRAQPDGGPRTLTTVAAARSGDDSDAVSASIELASPTIEARKVQAGWLGAAPLRLDAPTLPRSASDVSLRVSLLPGADALVHQWIGDLHAYPHRCWEQILSRGVAAAIAIERGDDARFPDARAALQEVIENIAVFQSESGAFRYFADGEDPGQDDEAQAQHALTAYSVRALRLLGEMGHAVPGEAVGRGEGFLQRRSRPSGDGVAQANQTAFIVAAQTRPGRDVLDFLWRQWPTLGLPARVATTRAMLAGQHPAATEAVAAVRDATTRRGEARSLRSEIRYDRWMSSDLREQCEFIGLLFDFPDAGDAALRRSLIAGLGELYAGGFAAVDTQTGASCLMALRALAKRKPDDAATLDIAHGEARGALRLAPGAPAQHWRRALTTGTAKAPLQLTPRVEGDAPASYVAELRYREDAREASATAVGFALARRYEVLRDRGWVAAERQTLRDGDWLRVTLTLDTGADRYFVAITDAVPGGLRPTDLALSGVAGLDLQKVSDEGSHWFRTRRLDPRAPKFYAEFLPAGRHEVHYFARVGNTGDYLAAPAVAELMYGASTRARTAAARVAIEAAAASSPEKKAE